MKNYTVRFEVNGCWGEIDFRANSNETADEIARAICAGIPDSCFIQVLSK